MNSISRQPLDRTTWMVVLALAIPLVLVAGLAGEALAVQP